MAPEQARMCIDAYTGEMPSKENIDDLR